MLDNKVQYECCKCYNRMTAEEIPEHVKEKKHYSYKLLGSTMILNFA